MDVLQAVDDQEYALMLLSAMQKDSFVDNLQRINFDFSLFMDCTKYTEYQIVMSPPNEILASFRLSQLDLNPVPLLTRALLKRPLSPDLTTMFVLPMALQPVQHDHLLPVRVAMKLADSVIHWLKEAPIGLLICNKSKKTNIRVENA